QAADGIRDGHVPGLQTCALPIYSGLLAAPHTSAGRIPTDPGLRLFVDGIMQVAEPRPEDRAAIEALIDRGGPIEEAISNATAARSEERRVGKGIGLGRRRSAEDE